VIIVCHTVLSVVTESSYKPIIVNEQNLMFLKSKQYTSWTASVISFAIALLKSVRNGVWFRKHYSVTWTCGEDSDDLIVGRLKIEATNRESGCICNL
jgi:hypothetical protein